MGGVAGQYFKQFGLTVAVAVFFSLLVARLITPMMAAFFMRSPWLGDGSDGRPVYRGMLRMFARKTVTSIPIAAAILGLFRWGATHGWYAGEGHVREYLRSAADWLLAGEVTRWVAAAAGLALVIALYRTWIGRPHPEEHHDGPVMKVYTGLLSASLWHMPIPFTRNAAGRPWRFPLMPIVTIAAGLWIYLVAMEATKYLPTGFIPNVDEARIVTSVELPPARHSTRRRSSRTRLPPR